MKLNTVLATLLFLVAAPAAVQAQGTTIVPPGESIEGLTQAEWSRAWWQWAGSFDYGESPVADRTGALCGKGQSGPVWFLAGVYGSQPVSRTCKVPAAKHIFFPIINYVVMPTGPESTNCVSATATAARITDNADLLTLDFNGVEIRRLRNHRQATPECFDLGARTADKLKVYPSAANGYYVMLRPLKAGTYKLSYSGMLPSMSQNVSYTLIVE